MIGDWFRRASLRSESMSSHVGSSHTRYQIWYEWDDSLPGPVPLTYYYWRVVVPIDFERYLDPQPGIDIELLGDNKLMVSMGNGPVQSLQRREAHRRTLLPILPHRRPQPLPKFYRSPPQAPWRIFAASEDGGSEIPEGFQPD